jgi:dipeptidyl aminopeptidase/acylaminoacyl peptidase
MTLAPGARLGPYQIVAPIAAGGMGEVFRARDTRLGREVAVKVLPGGAGADPERRARFEQEARSASALNHPNIVTLLDIGDADGQSYIAMEHVEGRTLRELVGGGALATRKTLDLAAQIADGLAKAHAAGIVHRDLKPENVMVSKDGFVKILDFGLAKLTAPLSDSQSQLQTAAAPDTGAGVVLGTVGYMSPEQASGRPVDFRSDQFALGAIVYEMATGKRPFQRATGAETLAAIIREEPEDVARVNPRAPAPLRWIIDRCLEKDPDDRFASTTDLARDLASLREHLSESTSAVEAMAPAPGRRAWPQPLAWLSLGLVAGAALAAFALRRSVGGLDDLSFTRLTFRRGTVITARFAPDGQSVVYGASWEGGPPEIHAVRFDAPESRSLGLPPADVLSVARNGDMAISLGRRYVFGWESRGTLARVSLGGGAPRELLEGVEDADWGPDGSELAVARDAGTMRRLEYPVGKVLFETPGWISGVRVSPDGKRVAFWNHASRGDNVASLDVVERDGTRRTLRQTVAASAGLAWDPDGNGVWTGGLTVNLLGGVRRALPLMGGGTLQDVVAGGRALMTRRAFRREMVGRVAGSAVETNLSWLDWSYPEDLSSDGRTVLFDEQNLTLQGNYAIHVRGTDGAPAIRLGQGQSLALSPDGKWSLARTLSGGGAIGLVMLPLGAGEPHVLKSPGFDPTAGQFFPDGRRLLLCGNETGRPSRLFVMELPDGQPKAISPEGVSMLRWRSLAPDGRTVAARDHDGRLGLYPTEGGEPRALAGALLDDVPIRWTGDGRGLFVQRGSGVPARVDVIDVASGARRPWKELRPPDPAGVLAIGPILLSADGQSYIYSYRRQLDDLYLVEGLR